MPLVHLLSGLSRPLPEGLEVQIPMVAGSQLGSWDSDDYMFEERTKCSTSKSVHELEAIVQRQT